MINAEFNFEDFLTAMDQMKKLGPLNKNNGNDSWGSNAQQQSS